MKILGTIEKEEKRQKGRIDRAKRLKEREFKKVEYEKSKSTIIDSKNLGHSEQTLGKKIYYHHMNHMI